MNIKILNNLILNDIYALLNKANIEYTEDGQKIMMACPVHGGDKRTACTIYKDTGKWYCWTHSCHTDHQSNLFAFFKAVFKLNTAEAVSWFTKYFGNPQIEIEYNRDIVSFIKQMEIFDKRLEKKGISRDIVVRSLRIPSPYFLGRGFSKELLVKYDVGDCHTFNKEMYNRAVVPVYDMDYQLMTGCVGRRLTEDDKYPKWKNSDDFRRSDNLYNIWFAKKAIEETGTVIICEGQGDVWRLEESGIHNAVGIFGAAITDNQYFILEGLPIFNMIILTDSDEVGMKAKETIKRQCQRLYNILTPELPKKDIGEMSIDEVKRLVCPLMEKL